MKVLNKEEIKAVALDVFRRYPKAKKVSVTSDGTAFITDEGDNAVKNHAVKNAYGKELQITPFVRDDFEAPKAAADEDLASTYKAIKEATAVEVVEAILNAEVSGKNRPAVIKAAKGRIEKLKA